MVATVILGALASEIKTDIGAITGPMVSADAARFRVDILNWNDLARQRQLMYNMNWLASGGPALPVILGDVDISQAVNPKNVCPVKLSLEQAIKVYNQGPWRSAPPPAPGQNDLQFDMDLMWRGAARAQGINPDDPNWRQIVDKSCAGAPLDAARRAFFRANADNNTTLSDQRQNWDYALERGGFRRAADQQIIQDGYFDWSPEDAYRLFWLGLIDGDTLTSLLKAAGQVQGQDAAFQAQLIRQLPDPQTLAEWATRSMFDDGLAARLGLDDAFAGSPTAVWWARAQGYGQAAPPLPGAPGQEPDWLKTAMRAAAAVIGVGEALTLQRRFRDDGSGTGQSVVPGVPAWTPESTKDVIAAAGYSGVQAAYLAGLVTEPINVRIINEVLVEALKHPNVAAAAQAAAGPGVDWVRNAFLDHGFAGDTASLAASALRAKAWDSANEELLANQKQLRTESRATVLGNYELGTLGQAVAQEALIDEFFTGDMAAEALALIDRKIASGLVGKTLAAVQEAFASGKITIDQAGAQMTTLGIIPDRQIMYIQEWTWERGDRARMLSTGEILQAIKANLMTPAVGLQRLTNLGWTAPDAAVEIALAEQEVAASQARSESAAASKLISATQRAQREAALAAKEQAKAEAAAAKAAKAAADKAAGAPLEQAAAASAYDAKALLDRDAYNAAVAKGNTDKAQAEIDKAVHAYQEVLLEQLRLANEGPSEQAEIKPVAVVPIPAAPSGAGAGTNAAIAPSQSGAAPGASQGSASPGSAGSTLPGGSG